MSVPLATKALCVLTGAAGACVIQGANDPVVERTALAILGAVMLSGIPIALKGIAAINANTTAQQVGTEALRALMTEVRDGARDMTTGRVQAVVEIKTDSAAGVAQLKERIDTSTDKILTAIDHKKKGGSAA